MKPNLKRLYKAISYTFKDQALITQALTHRSYGTPHNERLEFLGDAVLSLITAQLLYKKFPNAPEGILTRLRVLLVKGETLTEIALEFGLSDFLLLGEGELKSGGLRRASILADTLEAILGALYLESGFELANASVEQWFASRLINLSLKELTKDSKTQLQEYLQAKQVPLPVYEVISIEGQSHDQIFHIHCIVTLLQEPILGIGRSRRLAEQEAANAALKLLLEKGLK